MTPRRRVALGVALVVGALVARLLTYRTILPPDINNDEFSWAWAGQGILLHHGIPNAWSYLSGYPPPSVMANPVTHDLLPWQPRWLDHPPLFAALVGSFERIAGEVTPAQASIAVIRLVPLLCSTVCVGLLYQLLCRHCGVLVGAVGAALLAFTPTALRASALTEAEWLLAVFLLSALLLVGSRSRVGLAALFLLCAFAPLIKVTGVAVAASMLIILLFLRRWWVAGGVAAAGAAGILMIVAWGAFVSWPLFVTVMRSQMARHMSSANPLAFLLSGNAGPGKFLPWEDPIWFFGVAAALLALVNSVVQWRRTLLVLIVPVAVFSVLMGLIAPGSVIYYYGWYRIAIYPLVYGALAWLLVTAARFQAAHHPPGLSDGPMTAAAAGESHPVSGRS